MKIVIDPGHYKGYNKSPHYPTYVEGDRVWVLAHLLGEECSKRGFEVEYTRNKLEEDMSLWDRGAKAKDADIFISVHSNAPASQIVDGKKWYDPEKRGVVAVYPIKQQTTKPLCEKITAAVSALMGNPDLKTFTKVSESNPASGLDYYTVIRSSYATGCPVCMIVEHGFHTSPIDAAWLMDDANLKKIAVAEAEIFAEWCGLSRSLIGDVNGDGNVDINDVSSLLNILAGSTLADQESDTVKVALTKIKKGSRGQEVIVLQTLLNQFGFADQNGNKLEVDGIFGVKTEYALAAFHSAKSIAEIDCGKATWQTLLTKE